MPIAYRIAKVLDLPVEKYQLKKSKQTSTGHTHTEVICMMWAILLLAGIFLIGAIFKAPEVSREDIQMNNTNFVTNFKINPHILLFSNKCYYI
ncbi:hypothetical protein [Bacillus toyonensis]|uniref:hypothetical protein n=1 Tax=Bacillus toyonensis TaxID=155322 RepID=UPI00100AF933|nr:hypothetical protein [Bacillus toyonensis]